MVLITFPTSLKYNLRMALKWNHLLAGYIFKEQNLNFIHNRENSNHHSHDFKSHASPPICQNQTLFTDICDCQNIEKKTIEHKLLE